mgnify:CR=1 FL=1
MGMFSWICKGCGDELCCPEIVLIDGHVGAYDGYGRAGEFSFDEFIAKRGGWDKYDEIPNPVAWHEVCFDIASEVEQRDETPSDHAPNQGFAGAQDRFLPLLKQEEE